MKNNVINQKFAIGQKLLAKIKINQNYMRNLKYFAPLLFNYKNYTLNFSCHSYNIKIFLEIPKFLSWLMYN
jgi:hypothetical protein